MKAFDFRDNSFVLFRYIAAFQVLVLHLVVHFGIKVNLGNVFYWFTGVIIFFGLSGYLIANSLDRDRDLKKYCWNRFKRLFPELWIAVFLSTIVLIVANPSLLKSITFYAFNLTQATFLQFWTPNSLRFYGVGSPNGSLWTISTFVQFYIVIYLLYPTLKKLKFHQHLILLVLSILMNIGIAGLEPILPALIYKLLTQTIFPYWYAFYTGIIIYLFKDKIIPILLKYYWLLFITFIIFNYFKIGFNQFVYSNPLIGMLLVLFVIISGYKFKNIKIKKDYTFGIYLYHMIFVNLFIHFDLVVINNIYTAFVVSLLTIFTSYISSKFVLKYFK